MATTLPQALATLRRRYGDAVIQEAGALTAEAVWPTGIQSLDRQLLPGGLPQGRISVLAATARAPTGRLTLLQALASAASRDRTIVYLDLAGTLDPGFLADLGADLAAVLVVRPPSERWEEGLLMARSLVRAGAPWLGVALGERVPRASGWEHRLAGLAEAVAGRRGICLIAAPAPLPQPLAYASSLSLGCEAAGWQEAHGDVTGLRTRVTVIKSKVGAPGRSATLLLRYPRPYGPAEVISLPAVVDLTAAPAEDLPVAEAG
jgi:hypothetical protein